MCFDSVHKSSFHIEVLINCRMNACLNSHNDGNNLYFTSLNQLYSKGIECNAMHQIDG